MEMISQQEVHENDESSQLVSVIINCFNGEEYLHEAIQSVLNQTYQNWEIVFWDNKSTDKSSKIIKSFKDSRIKYFYADTHTKLYEARKLAVQKCKGEFLAFLDVDDTWEKFKLERQLPLFGDKSVGIVCGNFKIVRMKRGEIQVKKTKAIKKATEGYVAADLLTNYFVGLLTLVIRKTAYDYLDPQFDPRYNVIGDFDLVVRLASRWKLRYVHDSVATYRLHESNLSSRCRLEQSKEIDLWLAERRCLESSVGSSSYEKLIIENTYRKLIAHVLLREKAKAFFFWKALPLCFLKLRGLFWLMIPLAGLKRYF